MSLNDDNVLVIACGGRRTTARGGSRRCSRFAKVPPREDSARGSPRRRSRAGERTATSRRAAEDLVNVNMEAAPPDTPLKQGDQVFLEIEPADGRRTARSRERTGSGPPSVVSPARRSAVVLLVALAVRPSRRTRTRYPFRSAAARGRGPRRRPRPRRIESTIGGASSSASPHLLVPPRPASTPPAPPPTRADRVGVPSSPAARRSSSASSNTGHPRMFLRHRCSGSRPSRAAPSCCTRRSRRTEPAGPTLLSAPPPFRVASLGEDPRPGPRGPDQRSNVDPERSASPDLMESSGSFDSTSRSRRTYALFFSMASLHGGHADGRRRLGGERPPRTRRGSSG